MGREFMGIIRTTYLIDKKGKILKVWENVKVKEIGRASCRERV